MDKVQKHNSFNTNTPSSESYRNYVHKLCLYCYMRVYPKVSGLAACIKNCKWYSSLLRGAVV